MPDSYPKADITKRIIAALIDGVISAVCSYLIPWIGGLIGAAYMVSRDGLELSFMPQRSVGKSIMKLKPVQLDGKPMDLQASVMRNWMFGLGPIIGILAFIPFLGWMLIPLVSLLALILVIVEVVLVFQDENGRRFGDKLANTQVIESEA